MKESIDSEKYTESCSPNIKKVNVDKAKELCEEAVIEGWIYCEICNYKCKKKNTIKTHMRTKHSPCISCDECGNLHCISHLIYIKERITRR